MSEVMELVRRRINEWYVDDILALAKSEALDAKLGIGLPEEYDNVDILDKVFSVCAAKQSADGSRRIFSGSEATLMHTDPKYFNDTGDIPLVHDVYFGNYSLEQFIAKELAATITVCPSREKTLNKLLKLYASTPETQGFANLFLMDGASLSRFTSLAVPSELRVSFMRVLECILRAMFTPNLPADEERNPHKERVFAEKVLLELDRCFRPDWQCLKDSRAQAYRMAVRDEDDFMEVSLALPDDEYLSVPAMDAVNLFMMTRKVPFGQLTANSRCANFSSLIRAAQVVYMEYTRFHLHCAKMQDHNAPGHIQLAAMTRIAHKNWHVATNLLKDSAACESHYKTSTNNPINPANAIRNILMAYGIPLATISKAHYENAVRTTCEAGFYITIKDHLDRVGAGVGDDELKQFQACAENVSVEEITYLSSIAMLAEAYTEATSWETEKASKEILLESVCLKQENDDRKCAIERLEEQRESDAEARAQELLSQEIKQYEKEKAAAYEAKLQKRDNRIANLEDRLDAALEAVRDITESLDAVAQDDDNDGELLVENGVTQSIKGLSDEELAKLEKSLAGKKVLILGGHARWRDRVKNMYPYLPIVPSENCGRYENALLNADIIIFNSTHCSHTSFNLVKKAVRSGRAEIIHLKYGCHPARVGLTVREELKKMEVS